MRISDWSSDVCSSDLRTITLETEQRTQATEATVGVDRDDRRASLCCAGMQLLEQGRIEQLQSAIGVHAGVAVAHRETIAPVHRVQVSQMPNRHPPEPQKILHRDRKTAV